MEFGIGYHVVDSDGLEEGGTFESELSVVEFLRRVQRRESIPLNVTVRGLDTYLREADDPDALSSFIADVLADAVNYLNRQKPCIQFVVDDVEFWGTPTLPTRDGDLDLNPVFRGNLDQEGAGWFSAQLNLTS